MRRFAVLAVAAVAATTAASAQAAVDISEVDATQHPTLQFSVVTDTPSRAVPRIRENGRRVFGVKAVNLGSGKSVVLAIDRSKSMAGGALDIAAAAAREFVASKPARDRIAIVTFGHQASPATKFSSATIDADAELRHLGVDTTAGTALYDAVRQSASALAAEPYKGRVVIVLTDGANVAKGTTLDQAVDAARRAGAIVYAIGIESRDFSPAAVEQLATSTGGAYFAASSASAVGDAYDAVAANLARTWQVSYLTSSQRGSKPELAAIVPGHGKSVTRFAIPGTARAGAESKPILPRFLYAGGVGAYVLGLIVGGAVMVGAALALATPGSTRLRRRITPHLGEPQREKRKAVRERFGASSGLFKTTEAAFARYSFWRKLHQLLERANVPLRTVEFFYCMVGPALFFGFFCSVLGAPMPITLGVMSAGAFTPLAWVKFKATRRLNKIDDQLPDLLVTMAASLKAGHSFRQAMQAVVNEGQPPVSDEFKRVLTEAQLGRSMDDALAEMSDRVGSKNLSFVLTAVTIQRQVGGSLAGIFDMVADAVRQRQAFARKIRSLTAMGRASAYVLVGMPILLVLIMTLIRYEYVEPLYTTSAGHKLLITGSGMILIGSYFLKKIASFKG